VSGIAQVYEMKVCIICGKRFEKSIPLKKTRYRNFCSSTCYSRYWRINNPEKDKKARLRRYKENPEREKLREKLWRDRLGNKYLEWSRKWHNNWYRKNREKAIFQICQRERIKKCRGNFTLQEWEDLKKKCNYTCQMCGKKEPEIKLTIDHIIPISRGGINYIKNIQPLCRSCNSIKGIKLLKGR